MPRAPSAPNLPTAGGPCPRGSRPPPIQASNSIKAKQGGKPGPEKNGVWRTRAKPRPVKNGVRRTRANPGQTRTCKKWGTANPGQSRAIPDRTCAIFAYRLGDTGVRSICLTHSGYMGAWSKRRVAIEEMIKAMRFHSLDVF